MPPVIALGVAAVTGLAATSTAVTVISSVVFAGGLMAAQFLLSSKRSTTSMPPTKGVPLRSTVRQPQMPRQRCYGRMRTSGFVYFYEAKADVFATGVALCEGPINAFLDVRVGGEVVKMRAGAETTVADGVVTHGRMVNFAAVSLRLGGHTQTAGSQIRVYFPEWDPTNHRVLGTAHVELRIRRPPEDQISDVFPNGIPQDLQATIEGAIVWDPRDSTQASGSFANTFWHPTWTYTNRSALCILDYLRHPDGARIPLSWLDIDTFKQATNDCAQLVPAAGPPGSQEPRYTLSGHYTFDEPVRDVLDRMLATCDGELYLDPDGLISLRINGWSEPTVEFNDNHIIEMEIDPGGSDLLTEVNELRVHYMSPLHEYEIIEGPTVRRQDLITRSGRAITEEMRLPMVPSIGQAVRLARRELNKLNPKSRISLVTNGYGLMAIGERHIRVKTEIGYALDKVYRIVEGPFVASDLTSVRMELEEVSEAFYDDVTADNNPPNEELTPGDSGTPGRPTHIPSFNAFVVDEASGRAVVPAIQVEATAAIGDASLRVQGRLKKSTQDASSWRSMDERISDLKIRSGTVSDDTTYNVQARFTDPRGRAGDWSAPQNVLVDVAQIPDATLNWDYKNPNLPSTVPKPATLRFYGEAWLNEWNPVADAGVPVSAGGSGSDDAPKLNAALLETAAVRIPLIIPRDMKLGIRTPILLPAGVDLRAYGARLYKRVEFDLSAMITNRDPVSGAANPDKRLDGLSIRGLGIVNNHPANEDHGFGGDTWDIFFDNAVLEDIWCDVSNTAVPHSVDHVNAMNITEAQKVPLRALALKANGRYMVWAGRNVRMNRITHIGAAGALERTAQKPWASGITAGGFYCNGAEDSSITNFVMQSDDDCIINIPKTAGKWTGTTYPTTAPGGREDLNITRVTYAHGRCWGWTGKVATASIQPNMGQRPNPTTQTAAYNAWKLTWPAPQQGEISHLLFHDIKGFHNNNAFKVANTRGVNGIRNITFRDCQSIMTRVYDPDYRDENDQPAPGLAGNPNAIFIETNRMDDENGAQYDHDAPVEDITFENCTFTKVFRNIAKFKTNYQSEPNESFYTKLLPKRIWIRGGMWDRPERDVPSADIDGCDGGGISDVRITGAANDIIWLNDVPAGLGYTIEGCLIGGLTGSPVSGATFAAIDAGGGRPVYGLRVERNVIFGATANDQSAAVKFNGRASPLSFVENAIVRHNDFRGINPVAVIKVRDATESLNRNNQIYENAGYDVDTRVFVLPAGAALANLADDSIPEAKLAPGAALANIALNSIPGGKLEAGAALANLANRSIPEGKLELGTALANLASGSITTLKILAGAISEVYYANSTTSSVTSGSISIRPKAACIAIAIFDSDQNSDLNSPAGRTLILENNASGVYDTLNTMNINYMQQSNGSFRAMQTICMDRSTPNPSATLNDSMIFRAQLPAVAAPAHPLVGKLHLWVIELAR